MQVVRALFTSLLVWGVIVEQVHSETLINYLEGNPEFSLLVSAISASGWETSASNTSSTNTIFLPTNSAFNRMIKDLGISQKDVLANTDQLLEILDNHVISKEVMSSDLVDGDVLTSDAGNSLLVTIENNRTGISTVGSTGYITKADTSVTGSIVHTIDEVLLPFKKPELKSTLEVLSERSELSNFVEAINAAGIEFSSNVYTIFAPSNAAFENAVSLLGTDVASLLIDDYLTYVILTAHIIPDARFQSNELVDGQQLFSLEGSPINVTLTDDGVFLKGIGSDAGVATSDLYAQNAVIHVIDSVLFPYVLDDEPITVAVEAAPTFTPASLMDEIVAQVSGGCTCDEQTMKGMIREVMTEVLDKYLQ
eukprot:TRINITY_DN1204_c1_g1_i13.p1 TRINITY_DN1204_c1_g1~~TRINITY_DN1204_c1_g1_i13.p1  ORF type:complete len:414 (-),score=52.46 TRINITY_DN1204_c1_g1_i13:1146-2243(-)